jgi:hypothetical protein
VIRDYHFAGDPRAFAILGPLAAGLTAGCRSLTIRVWHDYRVLARFPRRRRFAGLVLVLLILVPFAVGCVRVRASLTVSQDDRVSARSWPHQGHRRGRRGPATAQHAAVQQQGGGVSRYERGDYVGSQAVFSDLTFAELPQWPNMSRGRRRRRHLCCAGRATW